MLFRLECSLLREDSSIEDEHSQFYRNIYLLFLELFSKLLLPLERFPEIKEVRHVDTRIENALYNTCNVIILNYIQILGKFGESYQHWPIFQT